MSKIIDYFKKLTKGKYSIAMGVLADVNELSQLAYDISPKDAQDSWFFEKCVKNRNGQHIIVVREGKVIIGFLAYRSSKEGVVELLDIGIRPDRQRKGIGCALIEVITKEEDYKEIWCVVSEYNLISQKFLKKANLKYWKTSKEFYGSKPYSVDGYFFRLIKENKK